MISDRKRATIRAMLQQRQTELISFFNTSEIKHSLNLILTYSEANEACFTMPFTKAFTHALGDTHGGIIATLLDCAGWFALAQHYPTWIATAELTTRLHERAKQEPLIAIGNATRIGKRIASANMRVETKSGRCIATGAGTFAITSAAAG